MADLIPKARAPVQASKVDTTRRDTGPEPWQGKTAWCWTVWSNLSLQAKNHGVAMDPYFNPQTGLLSEEVNDEMWKQLVHFSAAVVVGFLFFLWPLPGAAWL